MRLIIIGILVVLILLAIIVPLTKKKAPSFLTVFVLLVPAIALGYFENVWTENQEKLQNVFRISIDVPLAKLECERMSAEWFDAFVSVTATQTGRTSVSLKHSSCQPLFDYMNSENKEAVVIDNSLTSSVLTLAEAGVGVTNPDYDEVKARCLAVNRIPNIIGAMGGSAKYAYMVQEYYKNNMKDTKLTSQVC